jgi:uncharacterized membrane protein YfcA
LDFNLNITLAGAIVGFVVGLTGMGGGALMTPILVIFFNVQPLAAVSSDLVASLIMKPVGAGVHWRAKTVKTPLVKWLCIGSIPSAFAGVLLLRSLPGNEADLQERIKLALGAALLLAVVGIVARFVLDRRRNHVIDDSASNTVIVRKRLTLAIGIFGGVVVGMTSVGSGSLMIVLLMLLYPALTMRELVGTDLVQAVPLVGAAALGQLIFGDVRFGLTTSLLLGAIPAVYVGARLSSRAPSWFVRRALAVVLLASALKLLEVETTPLAIATGLALLLAVVSAIPDIRLIGERRRSKGDGAREDADNAAAPEPTVRVS